MPSPAEFWWYIDFLAHPEWRIFLCFLKNRAEDPEMRFMCRIHGLISGWPEAIPDEGQEAVPERATNGKTRTGDYMGKTVFVWFLMAMVPAAATAGVAEGPSITVMQHGKTVYAGNGNVAPAANTLENISTMIMKGGKMVGSFSAFVFPGNPVSLKQRTRESSVSLTLIPLPGKWIQVVGRAAGASTDTKIHLGRGSPVLVHLGPYVLEIVRAGV